MPYKNGLNKLVIFYDLPEELMEVVIARRCPAADSRQRRQYCVTTKYFYVIRVDQQIVIDRFNCGLVSQTET